MRWLVHAIAFASLVAGLASMRDRGAPPRPPPPSPPRYSYVPIGDFTGSCPQPFLQAIQRFPGWTIRIDVFEPRMCGLSPAEVAGTFTLTATTAQLRRPPGAARNLTADQRAALIAALDAPCEYVATYWQWFDLDIAIDPVDEPVLTLTHSAANEIIDKLFVDLAR